MQQEERSLFRLHKVFTAGENLPFRPFFCLNGND